MISFIGAGLVQAAKQGQLPSHMTGLVAQSGGEPTAVTAKIWPLFFNTLSKGFYSWIALTLAGLVAWPAFPQHP